MKKALKGIVLIFLVFVIGGIGGVYFNQHVLPGIRTNRFLSRLDFLKKASENVTVINNTEQITVKEDDLINEVSAQAANAVVNIVSMSTLPVQKGAPSGTNAVAQKSSQSGTGVIVTSDGLVVTYRSAIIESGARYTIFLSGGANYDATLVGVDEFTNLAYLKIDASNLTAISFANSDDFHPGRKLIAIGNSFGEYQNRFAAGLLSNNDRTFNLAGQTVSSSEKLEGVFQTDFIGQSAFVGGPVIGYSGNLVGIIGSLQINNQTVYFQIPSNVVEKSLEIAVSGNLANRPSLGVYYVPITKEYALVHNLQVDRGALVYSQSGKQGLAILAGSSAQAAGIQVSDIITAVNNQQVDLDNPLANLISQYKKGDTVNLTVLRSGNQVTAPVALR